MQSLVVSGARYSGGTNIHHIVIDGVDVFAGRYVSISWLDDIAC